VNPAGGYVSFVKSAADNEGVAQKLIANSRSDAIAGGLMLQPQRAAPASGADALRRVTAKSAWR
jgi:hypothetical protein